TSASTFTIKRKAATMAAKRRPATRPVQQLKTTRESWQGSLRGCTPRSRDLGFRVADRDDLGFLRRNRRRGNQRRHQRLRHNRNRRRLGEDGLERDHRHHILLVIGNSDSTLPES